MDNPINEISSSAEGQQRTPAGYKDIFYQLEQALGADVGHVRNFVQQGIITQEQGQYLLAQLSEKAKQINEYKESLQQPAAIPEEENSAPKEEEKEALTIFIEENPNFFNSDGRKNILDYLKGLKLDKDEILHISKLIENIENSAISEYQKKIAYEKSLNDENAIAKSKLTSYAQNAPANNTNRIFSREQIGAMSGKEFAQNEDAIYDQLKHGLIR